MTIARAWDKRNTKRQRQHHPRMYTGGWIFCIGQKGSLPGFLHCMEQDKRELRKSKIKDALQPRLLSVVTLATEDP